MKKLTALMLAFAMCFALVACAPKDEPEESPTPGVEQAEQTEESSDAALDSVDEDEDSEKEDEESTEKPEATIEEINEAITEAQEKYSDLEPKGNATDCDVPSEVESNN